MVNDILMHHGIKGIFWWARSDNEGSKRLAEKYGFDKFDERNEGKWEWHRYYRKLRKE